MQKIKAYGVCIYKQNLSGIQILLCKSVKSENRWGFLKGVQTQNETKKQTAIREFFEESGILVDEKYLTKYFEQINELKDIGIYLVNYKHIDNLELFFTKNDLKEKYICSENSQVRFIDIYNTINIKKKQFDIYNNIIEFLKRGSDVSTIN